MSRIPVVDPANAPGEARQQPDAVQAHGVTPDFIHGAASSLSELPQAA